MKIPINQSKIFCKRNLLYFIIVIVLYLYIGIENLMAASLTVEDIINGIEARSSKIHDIEIWYSITKNYHDGYYEEREKNIEIRKDFPIPLGREPNDIYLPPKKEANVFHTLQQQNKRAYEIYAINEDGTRSLIEKAVYDGRMQKYVNIPKLNGVVEFLSPDKFIRFPTPKQLLGVQDKDILNFIRSKDIESTIQGERIQDGDLIVELLLKLIYFPDPENKYGDGDSSVINEFKVDINVSKDFWPVRIVRNTSIVKGGEVLGKLHNLEISASDFITSGGMYIPSKINMTTFYHMNYKEQAKISSSQTTQIEKFSVNSGIGNEAFNLEFPEGTFYYDAIAGIGMVVGEPAAILSDVMKKELEGMVKNGSILENIDVIQAKLLQADKVPETNAVNVLTNTAKPNSANNIDIINENKYSERVLGNGYTMTQKILVYMLLAASCFICGYILFKLLIKIKGH